MNVEAVVKGDIKRILDELQREVDLRNLLAFERRFFQSCTFESVEKQMKEEYNWDIFTACLEDTLLENRLINIRRRLYLIQLDLELPNECEVEYEWIEQALEGMGANDIEGLSLAQRSYGDSWKKRGGVGAYMMMVRKLDRILNQVEKYGCDIRQAYLADSRAEGIWDDLTDMRRYMQLIQAEVDAI